MQDTLQVYEYILAQIAQDQQSRSEREMLASQDVEEEEDDEADDDEEEEDDEDDDV